MSKPRRDDARLVYNDDTDILGATEVPITKEDVQALVDAHLGTQVDTFIARTGCNGAYVFDTRVESRWGEGIEVFDRAQYWRRKENLRLLLAAGLDPLRIQIERGREVGIKVYPCVRIYDCQTGAQMDRFNREHPELRIGEQPTAGPAAGRHNPTYPMQLNFASPEVRARITRFVDDILARYDVEGLELDFIRRPHLFKPTEAIAHRHLLSDLVRAVRHSIHQAAEARKHPVEFVVRVPAIMGECWKLGIDVRTWMREGLLDVIVPAYWYFVALDHPVEEFVEEARGTPIRVHVGLNPLISRERGDGGVTLACAPPAVPYYAGLLTQAMWRAAAAVAYAKGAQGIELFNYPNLVRWRWEPSWSRPLLCELGDPAAVARGNKLYFSMSEESLQKQLPLQLGENSLVMEVVDHIQGRVAAGETVTLELSVYLAYRTAYDRLRFALNGQPLAGEIWPAVASPDGQRRPWPQEPSYVYRCVLAPPQVRRGRNVLAVHLDVHNPHTPPVTVTQVLLAVTYGDNGTQATEG